LFVRLLMALVFVAVGGWLAGYSTLLLLLCSGGLLLLPPLMLCSHAL
jgi:hypothetical protein